MSSAKTNIWVIDDSPACQRLVARSLPTNDGSYEFSAWLDAQEALSQLQILIENPQGADFLPDIVFMDFFLGALYGDFVTVQIREFFASAGLQGPLIIGHSSVPRCSARIVEVGGDITMRKDPSEPRSMDIVANFPDLASLQSFAGRSSQKRA